jgi:hypothetical protein
VPHDRFRQWAVKCLTTGSDSGQSSASRQVPTVGSQVPRDRFGQWAFIETITNIQIVQKAVNIIKSRINVQCNTVIAPFYVTAIFHGTSRVKVSKCCVIERFIHRLSWELRVAKYRGLIADISKNHCIAELIVIGLKIYIILKIGLLF